MMKVAPDEIFGRGVAKWEGQAPPRLRHKTKVLRNVNLVCAVVDKCVVGMGGLVPPRPRRKTMVLCRKQGGAVPPHPPLATH